MTATPAGADPPLLRLCLDLNVWCAALIATRRGRKSGSSQILVEIVRRGMCRTGAVQLVVSWGMLGRLQEVYRRDLAVDPMDAANYVRAIATLAAHGPAGDPPYLVLGGTGVAALRDEEDAHVLDVAVAGRAHLIATADLGDFAGYRAEVLIPDRVLMHKIPSRPPLVIAHPDEVAAWLRSGIFPDPETLRARLKS